MITPAEVIDQMLEWFADEDNWMKGATGIRAYPEGPVAKTCMRGGVSMAIWGDIRDVNCSFENRELRERVADLLCKTAGEQFPDRMPPGRASVPVFNDHPATTIHDVRSVLEKARVAVQEAGL